MSLGFTCHLFRTGDVGAYRLAFEEAARSLGGRIEWGRPGSGEEFLRTGTTPTVQTLELPQYGGGAWNLLGPAAAALDVPWMQLDIVEEALWQYSLMRGAETVDEFSTLPQYWDHPKEPDASHVAELAGRPRLLAELWQVPLERIDRYFVNWGMQTDPDDSGVFNCVMEGKAYATDQHPYGECRQMFDFLTALGGALPAEDHRAVLPTRCI